jgi:SDA1
VEIPDRKTIGAKHRLDARRLLTSEDFALLERLKEAKAERDKDPKFRTFRTKEKESRGEEDGGADGPLTVEQFTVDPNSLASGVRTGKTSKLERIIKCLEGRKDSSFQHDGHRGGLTNKEKLRKKNFLMVRRGKRSVNRKVNKSNSEQRWEKMNQKKPYGRDIRKRRRT